MAMSYQMPADDNINPPLIEANPEEEIKPEPVEESASTPPVQTEEPSYIKDLKNTNQKITNQLMFLQRKIGDLEKKGIPVPKEFTDQLANVNARIEEQALKDMTDEEKVEYWRGKANQKAPIAARLTDEEIQAQVDEHYADVLIPRIERYADALEIEITDEMRSKIDSYPVPVGGDDKPDYEKWEKDVFTALKEYASLAQEKETPASPARIAGRSLGDNSRPQGPAPSSEPDFFKTSPSEFTTEMVRRANAQRK